MTIEELENSAKKISESIFMSKILAMNYTNSDEEADEEAILKSTTPTWQNFCNDVETYFNLHESERNLFGERFTQFKSMAARTGSVTKEIINGVCILLHEMVHHRALVRGVQ